MTNDEKIKNERKRRIIFYLIIFFGIATIVLSIYSLVDKVTPIPAIISFVIETILSKWRMKLIEESKK